MWEFVDKGGPIVLVIMLCSVLAFAIVLERLYSLYKSKIDIDDFMMQIKDLIKRNRIMEAIDTCEKTPGPIANIIKAGIFKHDRTKTEIREAIEDAGKQEVPKLEKNISILATLAHISPLLGLLGTVTGMVRAFKVIEQKSLSLQPVNPGDLAGGIWEALLTTVAGLAVAIPTYVAYNYLVSRVNNLVVDMEKSATELLDALTNSQF